MTPREAGMSLAADQATTTPSLSKPLTTRLVRLLALNGVALYAGVVSMVHWLREVPIHYTFIACTLGFVLLFLALGMLVSGRLLGFFGPAQRRASPDWLPILLIWPIGFSILGCLALGLAGPQAWQQLTSALALPLALAAAAVAPLLLGRMPAWSAPDKLWHKLCDGVYALTTVAAALVLFVAIYQALLNDPTADPAFTATSPSPGFICKPGATSASPGDELAEEDNCPAAPIKPAATAVSAIGPPINQAYILWSTGLLLAGGVILVVGRAFAARGAQGVTSEIGGTPDKGASLLAHFAGLAEAEVTAHAGTLFGANGAAGGAVLTDVIGKLIQPGGAGVAMSSSTLAAQLEQGAKLAAGAENNRLSAQIAAVSPPPTPVFVPVAGIAPTLAVAPGPAPGADPIPVVVSAPLAQSEPAAAAMPVPPAEPVASAEPAPAAPAPAPATEAAPAAAPSPAVDETKQLRENLSGMQDKMNKQEQLASQLQDSVNSMSDKLAKQEDANKQLQANVSGLQSQLENQTKMLSQLAEEAQHSAEESRRTTDSLTRLMQGMKAELDRMSKSQAGVS